MGVNSIALTRTELASALAQWAAESKAQNWPERSDDQRHDDAATYLIEKIMAARA